MRLAIRLLLSVLALSSGLGAFVAFGQDGPDLGSDPTSQADLPPDGSRDRPIPGRTLASLSDGWQIAVIGVTPNANDAVRRQNQFNDPPAAGNQFFLVRVQVTNSGGSDNNRGRSFSAGDLRAVGDSGVAYTTFSNSCGVIPDALPRSEVFPGGSIAGNLCWQVRASDAGSLVMFYDVGRGRDAQRIYFALR